LTAGASCPRIYTASFLKDFPYLLRGIQGRAETEDRSLDFLNLHKHYPTAPKKAYKMKIDFGKFGIKTSIGRFTQHQPGEIKGKLVLGILNFLPRQIGDTLSEVLTLGVQYPKAESGEATFITPVAEAKIGGKLF
jgi:tRNA-binding protein